MRAACSVILIQKISKFTVAAGFFSSSKDPNNSGVCWSLIPQHWLFQWLWKSLSWKEQPGGVNPPVTLTEFYLMWDRDPAEYPQLHKERHLFSAANELLGNRFQSHNDLLRSLPHHSPFPLLLPLPNKYFYLYPNLSKYFHYSTHPLSEDLKIPDWSRWFAENLSLLPPFVSTIRAVCSAFVCFLFSLKFSRRLYMSS